MHIRGLRLHFDNVRKPDWRFQCDMYESNNALNQPKHEIQFVCFSKLSQSSFYRVDMDYFATYLKYKISY